MKDDRHLESVAAKHNDRPSGKEQFFEVAVFLFLIVPSMALSFFAVRQGSLSFPLVAFATMGRDLALVSLILFFLWHNGERPERIGWTRINTTKEIAWGSGLFVPFLIGNYLLERGLHAAGFASPATPLPSFLMAKDMRQFLIAALLVLVVAVAEETIFRGYLILRLAAVTRSRSAAAFLTAAIFALGHGYEGSAGVITVGVMGLVLAFVYLWRQSLVAPIVMHFLQDFVSIVLLPLWMKG